MKEKEDLRRRSHQEPVYARVVERIQQLLKSGELAPGDQLLPERQLAERLGVSRSTAREALAMLAGMGIIEITPRDGAYVQRRYLYDMVEPLAQFLYQEREQVFHLFEVRQIIETQAAHLAALRRTEEDIRNLRELNRQVIMDVRAGHPADESDTRFHVGIVEATKNPMLAKVMGGLVSALMEIYAPARRRVLSHSTQALLFLTEHERVVEAIADQDPDGAAQWIKQHIDHARERLEADEGIY